MELWLFNPLEQALVAALRPIVTGVGITQVVAFAGGGAEGCNTRPVTRASGRATPVTGVSGRTWEAFLVVNAGDVVDLGLDEDGEAVERAAQAWAHALGVPLLR